MVKFADFTLVTRSHSLACGVDTGAAIGAVAGALLEGIEVARGVRLLGVSASSLDPVEAARQLSLALGDAGRAGSDDPEVTPGVAATALQDNWEEVTAAVDAVRARFGKAAVGTVAMIGDGGIIVPDRRDAPWGPAADGAASPR
jgi:DNA polymerase-4